MFENKFSGIINLYKMAIDDLIKDEEFKNIPKSVLDAACERGSYVHKYIENTINNIDNGIVPLEYQIYIDYFYDWKNKHKPKFISIPLIRKIQYAWV